MLNGNTNYINSFSGASPARVASCDRRRSSNKSDRPEQGPLVPEGPLIDELIILNNSGDIRDKLKSMSKGKSLSLR